jgi:hypothetical protein
MLVMKLNEWKGPWPVLCRLNNPAAPQLRLEELVCEEFIFLTRCGRVGGLDVLVSDHWEVIDWFEEEKMSCAIQDRIKVGDTVECIKDIDETRGGPRRGERFVVRSVSSGMNCTYIGFELPRLNSAYPPR